LVVDDRSIDPLVEEVFEPPVSAGIQKISLRALGVQLETGIEYQWFVNMIRNPKQRHLDLFSSGQIRRVSAADLDIERSKTGDVAGRARSYANAGVWYDALSVLSDQIEAVPNDQVALRLRDRLLEQSGL